MLKGHQDGIWALFERTIVVSWVAPADDQAARERVAADIDGVITGFRAPLSRRERQGYVEPTWYIHEGRISGGKAAREDWRALFAEAQLTWYRERHG